MFLWKKKGAERQALIPTKLGPAPAAREPSALLAFLTGDFAGDIARLWPHPHSEVLLAPAGHRHLICLALSVAGDVDACGLRAALAGPLKRGVRELVPDAPPGLVRALSHLGERAWSAEDYRLLLGRLHDEKAAKRLRHADLIEAREVRVLAALPTVVVTAGGGRFPLTEHQGALLVECFQALERRLGPEAARGVAGRWAHASSAEALFKRIDEDLAPQEVDPPHPGTATLVPLSTRRGLANAGRRFRNCLRDRILDGHYHHYEWLGEPGAVISISEDFLFGWSLEEALAADNRPLPPKAREAIEAELKAMGVHVGRDAWELKRLVAQAARPTFTLPHREEAVGRLFGVYA